MTAFKITASTMGVSTPASRAEGTRYYRYNGKHPLKEEDRPSSPLPQNVKATSAKERRMAEFTRRRLAGESKEVAAAALGIRPSTASYYEREFQDQQRRESAP
jgi:hypothetical protein